VSVLPSPDGQYPVSLGEVQVSLAGSPLPLASVEAGLIVAVTPESLPIRANLSLVVTFRGGAVTTMVGTGAAAPGFFLTRDVDGGATVAASDVDGVLLSQANPIAPGSVAALYGTGFGVAADSLVTVNGVEAAVIYAGPVAGYPGLGQINIVVPPTASRAVRPAQWMLRSAVSA
jgi:uncharacterized protein (TIGR03437 family)